MSEAMFGKVLIANRGEIALRVVRACRELDVASVVAYSTADAGSPAVRLADEAVHIGPPMSRKSYLNVPNIVEAALKVGADAVHPGYGFLAEDADFAEVCAENGIAFIGPGPEVLRLAGDKIAMRRRMAAAGLPVSPGSDRAVVTLSEAEEVAAAIGYPVVVKASAGGGGRGIASARDCAGLRGAFQETIRAARSLFGGCDVYVERCVDRAGHVEVQVLLDHHGGAVHLGDRDCTMQRRRQKLVEESPSPRLSGRLREELTEYAVRGARSIGYRGAGTMEFLVDAAGRITFLELNGRIQVEHPVTEMVTGVDLVQEQLRVAAGAPLSFEQSDIHPTGVALECRINAEEPAAGFRPTSGVLTTFRPAGGPFVRVDAGFTEGDTVPPYYDSLLAKLVVWAPTRAAAVARMNRALGEFQVDGVHTTLALVAALINHDEFRAGRHTTTFVDAFMAGGDGAVGSDGGG